MKDLIEFVVKALVDDPAMVSIEENDNGNGRTYL